MVNIPRINQYYPSVPLSELSDLFAKGSNRIDNQRACLLSFLPKTLRVGVNLPFNNKYVLLIENTASVDSIDWSHELYLNGERVDANGFLTASTEASDAEYDIGFENDVFDAAGGVPLFDKLQVTCVVRKGAEELKLSVEHQLINLLNVSELGLMSANQTIAFAGNPDSTNYLINHMKDYLPTGLIQWNSNIVEIGPSESEAMQKVIASIINCNLLVASNTSHSSNILFDLNNFANRDLKSLINDDARYEGNFSNGICAVPVHILSDIMPVSTSVPDFDTVDVGSGNPVFNIIRDNGLMTFNDIEGEILRTVPQKIMDSKFRITNDIPKLVELYNLTLFPKSAIKLTAIVLKYLFECSKKNSCNECKNKSITWLFIQFSDMKDHPDFLKSLLTHYFREPINKIETFSDKAVKTAEMAWSPAIYTVLNVAPRILKAYFARKIVKQIDGTEYVFDFERIDSSAVRVDVNGVRLNDQPTYDNVLGRQVYLIVETLHCRYKELTLQVQPLDNTLNDSTANLEILAGNNINNYISLLAKAVGNHDDLRNTNNDDFSDTTKRYYQIDHQDKAIIKLSLKPSTRNVFDAWANHLAGNTAELKIVAGLKDNTSAFFGKDVSGSRKTDEFLSPSDNYNSGTRFRIVNRIAYEIYHIANEWNSLAIVGGSRRKLGKVENRFIKEIPDLSPHEPIRIVNFYYHDQLDNERFIAPCNFVKPRRRTNGAKLADNSNLVNVPAGFTSDGAAPGGDAFWNYYYANGDVVTRDNPAAGGKDYGIIRYRLASNDANDLVEVVRMPDLLNKTYEFNGTQYNIHYTFTNTQRRYANPGCFAAFVGVLAQLNFLNVQSTGMCFADATSYPSISHPNGDSIDTNPLDTPAERRAIIAAFRQWGFTQIISGTAAKFNGDGADLHRADHDTHLHSGNFDVTTVEDMVG
ncbi:hypothetical protein [Paenibacillus sp. OV219]|uniref:hypothetical protein n=1 Tax=Paenibacillus sp. OV219 TaxID=1884377 RepID=UPI0008D88F40|nr:hypothetical protein [Paenibacillus sp. OV219]SEM50470.1 hypothetical protein SAMN05518847_10113 [Paenibacillus sp. OV219]